MVIMNLNEEGLIYKASLTLLINGEFYTKSYVGQTTQTLRIRKMEHKRSKRPDKFHQACRKYSVDAFKWTVLEEHIPISKLNEREDFYINAFDTIKTGFNSGHIGYNRTFAFKQSQSERQKRIMNYKKMGSN